MLQSKQASLWTEASAAGNLSTRFLSGAAAHVTLDELGRGSILSGRADHLQGRSVLIATKDQLTAALALLELDGIARRVVLYPADLTLEHVPFVIASAEVDAIVSDRTALEVDASGVGLFVTCSLKVEPADCDRRARYRTEWVLLTSGTTGRPKLVVHTLPSLGGAIKNGDAPAPPAIWSTFYDIRRYGGLQIFLRAVLAGGSLVLSSAEESTADFLIRVTAREVTHISGTPTHWRRALMSPSASSFVPQYVRLSGEIADQSILNNLKSFYPQARVAHAFASTEAGVAFEVHDGLAGFPVSLIEQPAGDVEMKVEAGSLWIRSARTADRYLTQEGGTISGADGFVDTGDMLELRGDRYYFVGRRDGVINVGGLKVHPEEVEAVINSHPHVRVSLVQTRKNPIMGALVVAEVVLNTPANGRAREIEDEILQCCRAELARHKVPAKIHFVSDLQVASTGKMVRSSNA